MKTAGLLILFVLGLSPVQAQDVTGDSIPVRLNSLEAGRVNNNNRLHWRVTCLLEYAFFDIQRSEDGITYSTIHSFQADKARCLEPFTFIDRHNSQKSFYRVRVGDLDGRFYTSKIVVAFGTTEGFDILFPGIVNTNTVPLTIATTSNDKVTIRIISLHGYDTFKKQVAISKGTTSIPIPLRGLSSGLYVISVSNAFGSFTSSRFIKL